MPALVELEEERVPNAVIDNINDLPDFTEAHVELIDAAIESVASSTGALSSDVDHIELDSGVMENNEEMTHRNTNSIPVSSSVDPDNDNEIVAKDPEYSHVASTESHSLATDTDNVNNVPVLTEIENNGEDLPSTSTNTVSQTADFETLLLQFCKGSQKINEKVKRKRIAEGAEVITCEEVHLRLLNNPTCSSSRKKQKTTKDQQSTGKQSSVDVTTESQCGNNGTEKNHAKNRKKGKFISKKKIGTPETTSSESEQSVQYEDETDSEICEAEDQSAEFSKNISDMEIEDWVLVKFECQKSKCKYFISRIESFEEGTNDPIIRFVEKKQAKHDNIAEPVFTCDRRPVGSVPEFANHDTTRTYCRTKRRIEIPHRFFVFKLSQSLLKIT
ncbi:unnamed protein product [Phaedon cochleariae]|uniref:Uncharacterized protein n=1 Tax=Phaedon cochleariae TaxID=80249 RepID=A0A9N9X2W6_PHACE|nr:unnamed protein product [Phaedon cochleariae]